MKTALTVFWLWLISSIASAQGLVDFVNTPTTLVSAGPVGQQAPISGPAGSIFFGLLIASPGMTDPTNFIFTGDYATNIGQPFAGRFFGGLAIGVPGWFQGSFMSYLVAGWSASLGHDWDQRWLSGTFVAPGEFGVSSIGTGIAGGYSGGVPSPSYVLFGGATGLQSGWNLAPVTPIPEPSPSALAVLGTVALTLSRRQKGGKGENKGARDAEPIGSP
jgi:hypothetical protein